MWESCILKCGEVNYHDAWRGSAMMSCGFVDPLEPEHMFCRSINQEKSVIILLTFAVFAARCDNSSELLFLLEATHVVCHECTRPVKGDGSGETVAEQH